MHKCVCRLATTLIFAHVNASMVCFRCQRKIYKDKELKKYNSIFSPSLRAKTIKILSLRVKKSVSLETSVLFTIKLPASDVDADNIKWIGWEPNKQGKYLPKCASLASSMDPLK